MEGDFGIFRGVGYCGWVLGGLKWPSGGFPTSNFKNKPIRKSTGGCRGSTGGLQKVYKRMPRAVLEVLKVGKWVERVARG